MDPTFWIAHILALHLNVPEPVKFELTNLYPSEYRAQIDLVADDTWIIKYNIGDWYKDNESARRFVIAHELCHTVYEYHVKWEQLDKKEKEHRHKFVDACARKIIRDHKDCRW